MLSTISEKLADVMQEVKNSGKLFICLEEDKKYTAAAAARLCGVTVPSILNAIAKNWIVATKNSDTGYNEIAAADLIAYLKQRRRNHEIVFVPANFLIY